MLRLNQCVVHKIRNLQDKVSASGKAFQVFWAGPFRLVTGSHYKEGDLGVVIPQGAIIPDNLLDDMWLRGKLAGKKKNRVAIKTMFGYESEAIFYGQRWIDEQGNLKYSPGWREEWIEGQDVTQDLGITFSLTS
jgi:hypothetical protein